MKKLQQGVKVFEKSYFIRGFDHFMECEKTEMPSDIYNITSLLCLIFIVQY